jgi:serine/threonine protein kinase
MWPFFVVFMFTFAEIEAEDSAEANVARMVQLVEHQEDQLRQVLNPLEQSQFNIESKDLKLMERIGAGGCGWIHQATLGENTIVAAKEIMSTTIDPDDIVDFEHEARMLTQMNHPHVLRVFGFCTKTAEESKDHQEHKYIVTEFAPNGSLEDAIEGAVKIAQIIQQSNSGAIRMPFTKLQSLEWAVQIAAGMAFLHGRGFVHRDMKPQNVLLNKSNDALVADLGTVRKVPTADNKEVSPWDGIGVEVKTDEAKSKKLKEFVQQFRSNKPQQERYDPTMTKSNGTVLFMAPEQYTVEYSYPVDVWAYGVTLVRLFTLKWPYEEENVVRLVLGVAKGELRPIEVEEEDVPDMEVLVVIKECLNFDPKQRPSFKTIERKLSAALKRCRKSGGVSSP